MKPCISCGAIKERPKAMRCNACATSQAHALQSVWREKNRLQIREYAQKFYHNKNKQKLNQQRAEDRLFALEYYGNSNCECCGETNKEFLAMDHIHGLGKQHRKKIHNNIYRWLRINNYPTGFRVLCHNCNMSRGIYGYCPHRPDEPANYQYTNVTRYDSRKEVSNLG